MYFIWFRSLRALSNAVLVSKSCLSVSSSLRERRGEGRETKEEREGEERMEIKEYSIAGIFCSSLISFFSFSFLVERNYPNKRVFPQCHVYKMAAQNKNNTIKNLWSCLERPLCPNEHTVHYINYTCTCT